MDEVSKGIDAYRACVELPDDVTYLELKTEVEAMLRHARQGTSIVSLKQDIAVGLTNRLDARSLSDSDCGALAEALMEVANASRS
jgi:hypothetical protein